MSLCMEMLCVLSGVSSFNFSFSRFLYSLVLPHATGAALMMKRWVS